MKDFRELQVWHKAHKLALEVYKASGAFPKEEIYALTSQIRRAVVSIATNIAEGCGRGSNKELKQFLQISMGSSSEASLFPLTWATGAGGAGRSIQISAAHHNLSYRSNTLCAARKQAQAR